MGWGNGMRENGGKPGWKGGYRPVRLKRGWCKRHPRKVFSSRRLGDSSFEAPSTNCHLGGVFKLLLPTSCQLAFLISTTGTFVGLINTLANSLGLGGPLNLVTLVTLCHRAWFPLKWISLDQLPMSNSCTEIGWTLFVFLFKTCACAWPLT